MIETETLARRKFRRTTTSIVATLAMSSGLVACGSGESNHHSAPESTAVVNGEVLKVPTAEVVQKLGEIAIKGRAPKTGYDRDLFDKDGKWNKVHGCDIRNTVLKRDLANVVLGKNGCTVISGTLFDPYVGGEPETVVRNIDIDHVVSLSDAWQKGAQQWDPQKRIRFYNDTMNLQAVTDNANRSKSDNDISGWKPQKSEQCRLVARQVEIKTEYDLWVTQAEHNDMQTILNDCPDQVFAIPK